VRLTLRVRGERNDEQTFTTKTRIWLRTPLRFGI
jgi:hypothetical protein